MPAGLQDDEINNNQKVQTEDPDLYPLFSVGYLRQTVNAKLMRIRIQIIILIQ